jgi:membrane protein required for colicin V production
LLAVLGASLLLGAWRGLVYELMSMLGWIAAFVLAQWWAPEVALRLPMSGATEPVRYAAAFVLVFVAGAFAGGLLAWITRKLIEAIGLRPVLLLALAVVMDMTPMKSSPWWQTSTGAGLLSTALKGLRPVLPEAFGKYLPA